MTSLLEYAAARDPHNGEPCREATSRPPVVEEHPSGGHRLTCDSCSSWVEFNSYGRVADRSDWLLTAN